MAETQQQQQLPLFFPDGILTLFSEDAVIAEDIIRQRVDDLTKLYNDNGIQAFWSEHDLAVLHIVVSNHVMGKSQSDAAISDVEMYEAVYSQLAVWFDTWVNESNRKTFNDSVISVLDLSPPYVKALGAALATSLTLLDEQDDSGLLVTSDDRALYEITQTAKKSEKKEGWAKLRLTLVLKMIDEQEKSAGQT
jgi:hypothetical protein